MFCFLFYVCTSEMRDYIEREGGMFGCNVRFRCRNQFFLFKGLWLLSDFEITKTDFLFSDGRSIQKFTLVNPNMSNERQTKTYSNSN